MAGFHVDVQALLQDISDNNGETADDNPSLPYSRPNSNAYNPYVPRSMALEQTRAPLYDQRQLYAAQPSRLPHTYPHQVHNSIGLDAYDRALLAEPSPQLSWQTSSGMKGVSAGRLTLPGHTAPFSPMDSFEQPRPQPTQRVVPSPQAFSSQLAQYVHTPPAQENSSSSSNDPPSSPSFRIKQRQTGRTSRPPATHSATSLLPHRLPFHAVSANTNKRGLRICNAPELPVQPSFTSSSPSQHSVQSRIQPQLEPEGGPPIVQGVQLVSLHELPDRLRSVFRYPLFNAIQSKCFATAYKSNDNLVVSAPTGGGKTAILEMAICRLVSGYQTDQYKIVYMAPTKSLCSERQRDWQTKFAALDLRCAELTGDTEHGQLRNVQGASIVITTPEKWDSMTRKWKDHAKLMQMVKLFLIDEVHILKDTRGASLEAVVSRMKSVGSNVRFVALSATVPNSEDIASWLGKDSTNQHLPALRERFGEEFRPVRLQKYVVGIPYKGNDFGFEGICNPKLPDIIAKYSHKKPIMVFCITRNSTVNTAKLLATVWASKGPRDRYWEGPTQRIAVQDPELKNYLASGVAFHHAGLDAYDRHAVEKGFLEGQVNVICCTSTLAVGVNLPCHMVLIKNTMSFSDEGLKEYADLEIMQMLGRAGRPQFDTTAIAVIITKQEKAKKYEKLVSGEELLESCLHLNLIDHLNAEIGLGTIYDVYTAKRWLAGTFLYVRLGQNPDHYKLDGDAMDQNLDDRIERICKRDLALLQDSNLVISSNGRLKSTELGDAMARYYVQFKTMQVLLQLGPRAKISDILSALVQANEFQEIRLKAPEKKLYKELNRGNGIKYPIKVDLALSAHKRSLILQAELGGMEFPADEQYAKFRRQFNIDKAILFSHINRLLNCVIDCQIHLRDAVAARHALELGRSFSARVWDSSPYQMRQIAQIGLVAIRKLAIGGINSIEALEAAEPHRIEMLMSKNPPFGQKLLDKLKDFPKLWVSIKTMGKDTRQGRPVTIKIKAECGFMNEKLPMTFQKRPVYVCLLAERSDGHLIDFRRMSAKNVNSGQDPVISAELLSNTQYITCYVMCEAVAGTLRYAELKPELPAYLFPPPRVRGQQQQPEQDQGSLEQAVGRPAGDPPHTSPATLEDDEFAEDEIDDQDMVNAVTGMEFNHIDHLDMNLNGRKTNLRLQDRKRTDGEHPAWNPARLDNGKFACNHKCKDKTICKHMCCRDGVDKAPKPPKNACVSAVSLLDTSMLPTAKGKNAFLPATKKPTSSRISAKGLTAQVETIDLADRENGGEMKKKASRDFQNLQRLHDKVVKYPATPSISMKKLLPAYFTGDKQLKLSILDQSDDKAESSDKPSPNYENEWMESLPSSSALLAKDEEVGEPPAQEKSSIYGSSWHDDLLSPSALLRENDTSTGKHFDNNCLDDTDLSQFIDDDDEADMEAAMVGLDDSITMNKDSQAQCAPIHALQSKMANGLQSTADQERLFDNAPTTHLKGSSACSKLFLSTDSPEKSMELRQKRKATLMPEAEYLSLSSPVPKRPRLKDVTDAAIQASSSADEHAARRAPMIKPGFPAWVYEFDPEFIAEYQDFVDFV